MRRDARVDDRYRDPGAVVTLRAEEPEEAARGALPDGFGRGDPVRDRRVGGHRQIARQVGDRAVTGKAVEVLRRDVEGETAAQVPPEQTTQLAAQATQLGVGSL